MREALLMLAGFWLGVGVALLVLGELRAARYRAAWRPARPPMWRWTKREVRRTRE